MRNCWRLEQAAMVRTTMTFPLGQCCQLNSFQHCSDIFRRWRNVIFFNSKKICCWKVIFALRANKLLFTFHPSGEIYHPPKADITAKRYHIPASAGIYHCCQRFSWQHYPCSYPNRRRIWKILTGFQMFFWKKTVFAEMFFLYSNHTIFQIKSKAVFVVCGWEIFDHAHWQTPSPML